MELSEERSNPLRRIRFHHNDNPLVRVGRIAQLSPDPYVLVVSAVRRAGAANDPIRDAILAPRAPP